MTNTIGYMKCSKDQREQISGLAPKRRSEFFNERILLSL